MLAVVVIVMGLPVALIWLVCFCRGLNDDCPLGLRRILSQSTDSLSFRARAMSIESLVDEGIAVDNVLGQPEDVWWLTATLLMSMMRLVQESNTTALSWRTLSLRTKTSKLTRGAQQWTAATCRRTAKTSSKGRT